MNRRACPPAQGSSAAAACSRSHPSSSYGSSRAGAHAATAGRGSQSSSRETQGDSTSPVKQKSAQEEQLPLQSLRPFMNDYGPLYTEYLVVGGGTAAGYFLRHFLAEEKTTRPASQQPHSAAAAVLPPLPGRASAAAKGSHARPGARARGLGGGDGAEGTTPEAAAGEAVAAGKAVAGEAAAGEAAAGGAVAAGATAGGSIAAGATAGEGGRKARPAAAGGPRTAKAAVLQAQRQRMRSRWSLPYASLGVPHISISQSGHVSAAGIDELQQELLTHDQQQKDPLWMRLLLVSAEAYLPYERSVLSKGYLLQQAKKVDEFLVAAGVGGALQDAHFYAHAGVHVMLQEQVTSVDVAQRSALLLHANRPVIFRTLVIATGVVPLSLHNLGLLPPVERSPSNVYVFRSAADAAAVLQQVKRVQATQPPRLAALLPAANSPLGTADASVDAAAVLGTGFTGVEVAAALQQLGVKVYLISRSTQLLSELLPAAISAVYEEEFRTRGVQLFFRSTLQGVVRDVDSDDMIKAVRVVDANGLSHVLSVDFLVAALGNRPAVDFIGQQLLQASERAGGGILVDKYLRAFPTAAAEQEGEAAPQHLPAVFAIGDVAAAPQPREGNRIRRYEHVWNARESAAFVAAYLKRKEREAAAAEAAEDAEPLDEDQQQQGQTPQQQLNGKSGSLALRVSSAARSGPSPPSHKAGVQPQQQQGLDAKEEQEEKEKRLGEDKRRQQTKEKEEEEEQWKRTEEQWERQQQLEKELQREEEEVQREHPPCGREENEDESAAAEEELLLSRVRRQVAQAYRRSMLQERDAEEVEEEEQAGQQQHQRSRCGGAAATTSSDSSSEGETSVDRLRQEGAADEAAAAATRGSCSDSSTHIFRRCFQHGIRPNSSIAEATPQVSADEAGGEEGYAFFPFLYSHFFDFSWKFFGFRQGEVYIVNDLKKQKSKKILAVWIKEQRMQGSFIEGGDPAEERLLQDAAKENVTMKPEEFRAAQDVAAALAVIKRARVAAAAAPRQRDPPVPRVQ